MSDNLCECSRCRKILINEEFESHKCSPLPSGTKGLTLDYYTITKDEEGREVIIAKDMKGIIYTMTVLPSHSERLSFVPTNRKSTTENNNGRFNRTIVLVS